jgi:type VI secretion system Hcp family effector
MKSAASTTAVNTYSFRRYGLAPLLLGTALALNWTANADAATVIYLKWSDRSIVSDRTVVSDSTSVEHAGEVALTSFRQNVANSVNLANAADKTRCGQITITKQIDRSSPVFLGKVLMRSITSATVPVTITFERSAAGAHFQFYKVELYEVMVRSIAQSDIQADTVEETIMLDAGKVRYSFTP